MGEKDIDEKKVGALQSKYQHLQLLDQQMQALQKQGQMLEKQVMDMAMVEQALEDMKSVKEGDEVLIPLTSGIFAQGVLKDNKKFVVNIGANITVEKSVDEVKAIIKKQIEDMGKMQTELQDNLKKLAEEGITLQKDIQELV